SALTTMSRTRPLARGVRRSSSSGWEAGSTRDARLLRTRSIWVANGRPCMMRSWARRSRDAATIFIALVICCVDLTARMRRRRSNSEGMEVLRRCRLARRQERLAELLERVVEIALDRVVDLLLVGVRGEQI